MILRKLFSTNNILKALLSLPVILIVLYFLPVLGVIMLIARYFVYGSRNYYRAPILILIFSLLLLIPRGLELAMVNFNFNISIPYLNNVLNSELYPKLVDYAQNIFIISVVFLIVSAIIKAISSKLSGNISRVLSEYFSAKQAAETKTFQENDLKLKEKAIESQQKTPHVVKCPTCGKTNSITGTVGKCKSCRNPIEYKESK